MPDYDLIDYLDEREAARADELADARYEAAQDEYYDNCDATCEDCETEWQMGWMPATRYEPAECRYAECPRCGGQPKAEGS